MIHAESSYDRPLRLVVPFFVLHLVSFFSLSVLVGTILLAKLSRDKTLCGLLVTFVVFNWSTGLIAISGGLIHDAQPSFGLCLANAALVLGGSAALSAAALALTLRVFLLVLSVHGWSRQWASGGVSTAVLLALPYGFWTAVIIPAVLKGRADRAKVHRAVFYCVVDDDILSALAAYVPVALLGLTIILQIIMAFILLRHWRELRKLSRCTAEPDTVTPTFFSTRHALADRFRTANVALVIRVIVFSGCVIVAFVVALLTADDFSAVSGDFAIACIGPSVFVIFGSQRDVLKVWHLDRSRPPKLDVESLASRPPPQMQLNSGDNIEQVTRAKSQSNDERFEAASGDGEKVAAQAVIALPDMFR